jgi:heterodisulfide reductase subunit C
MSAIIPEPGIGSDISSAIRSELSLCYTCGSCAAECPVNRATNRLQPLKFVRMAGLGLAEEILRSPEIWYCLSCNRCTNICPMTVKPAGLLSFFRQEAIRRGYATKETALRVAEKQKELHRVRFHSVTLLKEGKKASQIAGKWDLLAEAPIPGMSSEYPSIEYPSAQAARFRKSFDGFLGRQTNITSCFTCFECTNSCPVARQQRSIFDPMRIVRMVTLGLREELLTSPSIWLCLGCETCTTACGQRVRGHMVLRRAQELAIEGGFADGAFHENWLETQRNLFTEYVNKVDALLPKEHLAGIGRTSGRKFRLGEPVYEVVH